MKKLLLLLAVMFGIIGTSTLCAQVSFSTSHREYCYYDEDKDEFTDCFGWDESSLFVMNEKETMFTHTIESMTSTYYVKDKEYDHDKDVYTYKVVSDVGNEYYYVFDLKNYEIRCLGLDSDENIFLLTFRVKAIF